MIKGHGDDRYQFNLPVKADFSSNVWYAGLQKGLEDELRNKINEVIHYPDPGAWKLQAKLEQYLSLSADTVMVTNGGTEAIYLIAQAFTGATVTIVEPTFAEYEDACKLYKHQVQFLSWEKLNSETSFSTDMVFICNPNNPTGQAIDEHILEQLITQNKHTVFVLDEAYIQFTHDTASMIPFLKRLPNLLVLRSLTKSCCIPGLRLGYIAGRKQLLDRVRVYKMPWSVNAMAITAGEYILDHPTEFEVKRDTLLEETYQLWEGIRKMPEFKVMPTHTHYFLFETLTGTAAALKMWLLEQHGLLIRDASNFYGLGPGHCRVACQQADDNKLLITALRKWTLS
ncbi:pyridoxal phosphate-dependent class II aminotransferase [Chitinophaga silvatica]|uniref:Pyridoxal phosphate-dependent class II aminotransferase n=1 Tax=Chitinophaga silvatica TaxID=2282649 RepID=A0A3E1YHB8_9BACT|nr:aminotransferase class I/II-fold pyridoxal phosphate-dependent enzyme [Chitinophaga silvatica]RFS26825.1 pyridoxal phosphate-dependent class II aminotransferase [Chitinophaga silvatica]